MAKTRLNLPRIEPTREAPFADDKIGRKPLADRITRVLEEAEDAVVLAVDGGWGTGKSTFARMLQAHLDGRGFQTTYIDAFAVDYVEDPFLPIFARLQALIQQEKDLLDKSQDVLKKAARVAGVLLAKAGSAAVNMAVQAGMLGLTGVPLLGADKLGDKAAEAWEELAARRISGFLQEEQYIEDYKQALATTAQAYYVKHDKPLVILIDELDRCRPDFAVLFLERIKHFFEVPHIAFVLIIHRDQLEKSIRGCYGADIDARTYLQKFITLSEQIDSVGKQQTYGGPSQDPKPSREIMIESIFRESGFNEHGDLFDIVGIVREFELSIRDLEKIRAIIQSSEMVFGSQKSLIWYEIGVILIIAKFKDYALFRQLLQVETLYPGFSSNPISKLIYPSVDWDSSKVKDVIERFHLSPGYDYKFYWRWIRRNLDLID